MAYTLSVALLVSALVGCLSLYVSPYGAAKVHQIFNDPKTYGQINTVVEGRFQISDNGSRVTYTEAVDQESSRMQTVFIAETKRSKGSAEVSVVVADQGQIVRRAGNRYLQLDDGYRYRGEPGKRAMEITRFESYGQLMEEPEDKVRRQMEVDARPSSHLMRSTLSQDRAELQWRLSLPLLVPIVALIALSLSKTDHRRGRFAKLLPAIIIYLLYLLLLSAARSGAEDAQGQSYTIWLVHALFLLVGLAMFYQKALRARFSARTAQAGNGATAR